MNMYMFEDYADKTITKDTNVTDLNHHYNTRPISTRWKHQLEKHAGEDTNHMVLKALTLAGEKQENLSGIQIVNSAENFRSTRYHMGDNLVGDHFKHCSETNTVVSEDELCQGEQEIRLCTSPR